MVAHSPPSDAAHSEKICGNIDFEGRRSSKFEVYSGRRDEGCADAYFHAARTLQPLLLQKQYYCIRCCVDDNIMSDDEFSGPRTSTAWSRTSMMMP